MKRDRKSAKKDGYIKNQRALLRESQLNILVKMAVVVVPIVLFLMIAWGGTVTAASPDEWEHTTVTYSGISIEKSLFRGRGGSSYTYILNTTTGERFHLTFKESELVSQLIEPLQDCNIVYEYNKGLFSSKRIEAISCNGQEIIKLEDSVASWEKNSKALCIATPILLFLMAVGVILIDALWCKKDHRKIAKIKAKIANRLERKSKRENR